MKRQKMKNIFFLCLTWYFTSGRLCQESENFTRQFIQTLDHFDKQNLNTWKHRYFVNDEFLDKDKRDVAFLFITGSNTGKPFWVTGGEVYEYAPHFSAIIFELEHRYYGESRPTANASMDNLRYLSSQQALADIAEFIVAMNKEHNLSKNVKWIIFGCSYAGLLSAKMRQIYPHLVAGAVSSSAPMLNVVDFKEFFQVVADDLRATNENCLSAVQTGMSQVETLLETRAGATTLNSVFKLCTPIEDVIGNKDEMFSFFDILSGYFAEIAQFNKDNTTPPTSVSIITLDTICDIMTDVSKREIDRLASVSTLMFKTRNQTCFDYSYSKSINELRNESWETAASSGRQWLYQDCTEFVNFQTSKKGGLGFGEIPLEGIIKRCTDVFGPQFNETYLNRAVEKTNTFYGGLDIKVSNVVFVQGSVDPWHKLGIINSTNEDAPAIFIQGTAHCANMYPSSDTDLPQLTAAREQIKKLIQSWLGL